MSVSSILIVVIIGFFLAIALLLARILLRKSQQDVADRYQDIRYQKYSRMIDETIAHQPKAPKGEQITKQEGDEKVLETLLHGKLELIKGEDRALVALVEKPDRWPVRRLAEIIVGIGPDAIDPLLVEFTSTRPEVRARAAKSLGKIGDQIAIWPLAELLKDRQWWVRRNAGYALPTFGEPGFEMLERSLSNPDPYAAERALEVLQETGRIGKFIKDLGSTRAKARSHAVALMVAGGRVGGLAPLIDATKRAGGADAQFVASLIEVWRELTEYLTETLASGDKQTEMRAIESTNKIVYSFVISDIRSFADLEIAGADTSLAEIDQHIANIKQAIGHLKQDVDPEIREEAASTLNFMER